MLFVVVGQRRGEGVEESTWWLQRRDGSGASSRILAYFSLAKFDCWRTSTIIDMLEFKLLESVIQ